MLPTVYRCNALPLLDRRPRASSHDLVKDIEIRISASLVNARLLRVAIAPSKNIFGKFSRQFCRLFFPQPYVNNFQNLGVQKNVYGSSTRNESNSKE